MISCPTNKTFAANAGDCQKLLTIGDIGTPTFGGTGTTVVGVRSDNLDLVNDPYPAGQTAITWTATNTLGSVSCTQIITITTTGDTIPPTLTIPPDINLTTTDCFVLLDDELGIASATDNCTASVMITRTGLPQVACPIPGNPTRTCDSFNFPTGTTNITYTATDASGNQATAVQHVTIHENTPPTFTFVPSDVGPFYTGPGATTCGTFVGDATLGTATASDNCSVTVTRSGVPAGNNFPVGDTDITYTAADPSGNTITAHQHVTVVDNTPPVVTAPAPVTLYTGPGATSCSVTVSDLNATLGTGSATDNCPGVGAVTRSGVPAGNTFPLGNTTLTYSATDAHSNSASATQNVTVVDNTPPVVTLNGANPMTVECHTSFTDPGATADDNCAGNVTSGIGITGSVNPNVVGTYTLTYSVGDGHGNTGTATRTVNVVDTIPPVMTVNNLTIFFNNKTIVFNTNSVTINGVAHPFNGVSFTDDDGVSFSFNGQTVSVTINGHTSSYTFSGNTLVLWTPTHQYQTVNVADLINSATDGCATNLSRNDVVISRVTSDEPEDIPGNGDGATLNDIVIAPNCKSVQLRAERDNNGNGRVYTITFRVSDGFNVTTVTSKLKIFAFSLNVVDDGPHYTVNGSCP
jgi:hypothetical protein